MRKSATPTPEGVKKSVRLLCFALTFFGMASSVNRLTIYDTVIIVCVIAIFLFSVLAALRGYRWARILFFVPLTSMILIETLELRNGGICLFCIVSIAMTSYGIFLLFRPPARDWFI